MRSLMLLTKNQYSVVSHFFDGIQHALETMGFTVDVLFCDDVDTITQGFQKLEKIEAYQHVFSFNGNGLGKISDSFNTLDFAKTKPVYVFCVDNPIHVIPRFYGHPVTVLCVAKEHVSLMQQFGHKAHFFPHAVTESSHAYPEAEYQYKNQSIVYPISFMSSQKAKDALTPVWGQLKDAIEASSTVTDFLKIIGVVPTATSPARIKFDENIRRISVLVDKYLRARDRELCLLECASRNVKLKVIGRDSQQFSAITDYHDYKEACSFSELLNEFALSKWVLHQTPGFEEGLHERVVYPLVCGTPVMLWKSPFIYNAMKNKGVIDVFSNDKPEDEEHYLQFISEGRQEVLSHHTWTRRLTTLLNET